jgi:hypothetical protein
MATAVNNEKKMHQTVSDQIQKRKYPIRDFTKLTFITK